MWHVKFVCFNVHVLCSRSCDRLLYVSCCCSVLVMKCCFCFMFFFCFGNDKLFLFHVIVLCYHCEDIPKIIFIVVLVLCWLWFQSGELGALGVMKS